MEKRIKKVSQKKLKMFDEIVRLVSKTNTLIVSSAQNIPSSQLQSIRNKLKEKAAMRSVKKQIMLKAIEELSKTKKGVSGIKEYITENSVLLFSDLSPFELAGILSDNRIAKKAKAGQIAPIDIEIEPGPTDMPAGPMISELSSIGLKVAIENGKIVIKEAHVAVKKDDKISEIVANIMIKLGILPFNVGLETLAAYDCKADKVYIGIRIDKAQTEKNLKEAVSSSRALAFSIEYPAKEVIGLILAKAVRQAQAIERLSNASTPTPEKQNEETPQTQN